MSAGELSKTYDPRGVEPQLYERWLAAGYFHTDPDPSRPPFAIAMPPPNVTGRAHLGHASTYTLMDVLVRFHRMLGENAVWLPGQDHAAIATEAVLVRALAKEGHSRDSLGREEFLRRAWDWREQYGGEIAQQWRRLGFSADWERERFTLDAPLSRVVARVFVALYRDGLIYRGKRLINWDPEARTTVSDAEIEHVERDTSLWQVAYPFAEGGGTIVVATTRPETILADVAIAVHPEDDRYRKLIGKHVLVPPLRERTIPLIADPAVDMEFGTGAVKVTPAHDAVDYEIGLRHALPMPSVIDFAGTISDDDVPAGRYRGMDRNEARAAILADLHSAGLLCGEVPHHHTVGVSDRSGAVVEPMLSLQWFCKTGELAKQALDAYRGGRVRFVPERHGRTYEQWLENIRDWNISRQVWWGHRLPVWYTPNGEVVVAEDESAAREQALRDYGTDALTQDPDTLDTWFSSALWPFSILGWPERTSELEHWYPTSVLVTAREIIFLWVARMVMLGLRFAGDVPFRDVFIAPLVFDAQGRKMSKSLGNAIDPDDFIERFGADATRLGIVRQIFPGAQEVRFRESRVEEARNFNNKLWNAARYVLTLPEPLPPAGTLPPRGEQTPADRWILQRLRRAIVFTGEALQRYDFAAAAETVWKFLWLEFCDWYLEASKVPSPTRASVLSYVLNAGLRLLHPIEPFISEALWLALPHDGLSITTASWPDSEEVPEDGEAEAEFSALIACVEGIRNLRAELGLSPKQTLAIEIPSALPEMFAKMLVALARGEWVRVAGGEGGSAVDALRRVRARAPHAILEDRLRRERERLQSEVARSERKLANADFVNKAPHEAVAKERAKLEKYRSEMQALDGRAP